MYDLQCLNRRCTYIVSFMFITLILTQFNRQIASSRHVALSAMLTCTLRYTHIYVTRHVWIHFCCFMLFYVYLNVYIKFEYKKMFRCENIPNSLCRWKSSCTSGGNFLYCVSFCCLRLNWSGIFGAESI